MSGREIRNAVLWVVGLMAALAALVAMIAWVGGCTAVPLPPPVTPEPGEDAGPPGTPCERAADNYLRKCETRATFEQYVAACEGHENLGGAASWNPECQARAETCEAIAACRGGT